LVCNFKGVSDYKSMKCYLLVMLGLPSLHAGITLWSVLKVKHITESFSSNFPLIDES
jgi:hypothetical protein